MVGAAPKVAVIGAGMAGLTCAQELHQRGVDVVVFDKGRGLGGRMATRRAEGGFQFDHGAQVLLAQGVPFAEMLKRAEAAGAAARWSPGGEDLGYVGQPGMTGLAKYLGAGLGIHKETRVDRIANSNGRWTLSWDGGEDTFDRVVVTTPAPQLRELLPEGHAFDAALGNVTMDPSLTLMVGLAAPIRLPFETRTAPEAELAWIACDSTKPARPDTTCIVAQASRAWSLEHLELDKDAFARAMLPLLADAIGADPIADPAYVSGHRWRYAFVSTPLGQPFLADDAGTLFAGGDWCLGARAEHAWESGQAIAARIIDGL